MTWHFGPWRAKRAWRDGSVGPPRHHLPFHAPLARVRFRGYVRQRLHRRLFASMGLAIFVSLVLSLLISLWWGRRGADFDPERVQTLVGAQVARVWDKPAERQMLLNQAAEAFLLTLSLSDASGQRLADARGGCARPQYSLLVQDAHGKRLGDVAVCFPGHRHLHGPWLVAPLVFALLLWMTSGIIARRLGRPLGKLVEVTQEIGQGKLSSRARLGRHEVGELGVLAESINDMAARIEKQLDDQKELLAAVSHEMRTPLSRLRVLSELLEGENASQKLTFDMQREILELDDLIGQLLAHSRLEFRALESTPHDPIELARVALERAGQSEDLLQVDETLVGRPPSVWGDATLLTRALLNLLNNAQEHAGGATGLFVRARAPGSIEFSVEDCGPGLSAPDLPRVFARFYRGEQAGGTLGLGLSLVRRIAVSHGGDARVENLKRGGVRVSFWVRSGKSQAIPSEHDAGV